MKEDYKKGKVYNKILKSFEMFKNISSGDLIDDISIVDIGKAVTGRLKLPRDLWDCPEDIICRNLENDADVILYATRIYQRNPKNIARAPGDYLFTTEGPIQQLRIYPSRNYIELITETDKLWNKIAAHYDENNNIIYNSIEEELSAPWDREKRDIVEFFLKFIVSILSLAIKAILIFGLPAVSFYMGIKCGNVAGGFIGTIIGSLISCIFMANFLSGR